MEEQVSMQETTQDSPNPIEQNLSLDQIRQNISKALSDDDIDDPNFIIEKDTPNANRVANEDIEAASVSVPKEEVASVLITQPIWDKIKATYETQHGADTFVMPDGINKENEYETLIELFANAGNPSYEGLPVEIQEQITLHEQGAYNPKEYFKKFNTQSNNLSDKEIVFEAYKAKYGKSDNKSDGLSDDEIYQFVEGKSKIEVMEIADSIRQYQKENEKALAEQQTAVEKENQKKQLEKIQSNEVLAAQKIVNQLKNDNDFFGIEFSRQEKERFDKDFIEMVKFDPNTGRQKLQEMLLDHKTLYKIAGILWKGDGVKGYLSQMKENLKVDLQNRLDPTLQDTLGSAKISKEVDRSLLY